MSGLNPPAIIQITVVVNVVNNYYVKECLILSRGHVEYAILPSNLPLGSAQGFRPSSESPS